jgi:hypothetical protein
MKILFKKYTGAPGAADKVGDYNFKEHYPDVNRNMSWSELLPYIRQATRRFVIPFVGEELYDALADMVIAGAALDAAQEECLERLRDAVAYYTIMVTLPKKKTVVSSMGAVENTATEGTTGSSLWGFKTTLWSVAQDADRLMDEVLEYLEKQVVDGNLYFALWKNSNAYLAGKSDIFRTTSDFQNFQNINKSRRTFVAMLPVIKQAAKRHIIPAISEAQYDDMVTKLRESTLSANEKKLLEYVRAALAAWSVHYAAEKFPVLPDQDGFRIISNAEAVDQRAYSAEVTQAAISGIKYAAEADARQNTADLVAFLHDNADTYPLWKASTSNPANNTQGPSGPYATDYGAVML